MSHSPRLSLPPDTATSTRSSGPNMRYFSMKRCVLPRIHSTKCSSHSANRCCRMLMTARPPHFRQRIPGMVSPARNHGDQLDLVLVAEHRRVVDQLTVLHRQDGLGVQANLEDEVAHGDATGDFPLLVAIRHFN